MRKLLTWVLAMACCLTLAACGSSESSSASSQGTDSVKANGEVVTIKWVAVGSGMPANYDAWKKNLDSYLEEKIGVNLDVEVVSWSDWSNRRSVIVNTNENYDIMFTDGGTYASDVNLGAFLDISDMVKTEVPDLYSYVPEAYWDATKIGGKIYAVPTYKDSSATQYFVWDKGLADKYNVDYNNMHKLSDLTDALTAIKDGENISPFLLANDGVGALPNWYDHFSTGLPAIGVYYNDKNRKVVSVFEQKDVMDNMKLLHSWFESGIINSDAATLGEAPKYRACYTAQGWSGAAATTWGPGMGVEATAIQWGDTVVSNETVQGSLNCISSSSKNPEKALQLLQLVNTDSYVRDALYYGLEGDDFDYTSDGKIHRNKTDWTMAGYTQGTFFKVSQTDDVDFNQWDEVKKLNEEANPSVLLGFSFDSSSVSDQLANCTEIYNRYKSELLTGTVDPETGVAEMMQEMRAAGFDDIVAAAQTQVDAAF